MATARTSVKGDDDEGAVRRRGCERQKSRPCEQSFLFRKCCAWVAVPRIPRETPYPWLPLSHPRTLAGVMYPRVVVAPIPASYRLTS